MDRDAVRELLEAAYQFVHAGGLRAFSEAEQMRAEDAAIDRAVAALDRLLTPMRP